jgi:hypothetical protein
MTCQSFFLTASAALLLSPALAVQPPPPVKKGVLPPLADAQVSDAQKQSIRQAAAACQKGSVSIPDRLAWGKALHIVESIGENDVLHLACLKAVSPGASNCADLKSADPAAKDQPLYGACLDITAFASTSWRVLKQPGSSLCAEPLPWPRTKGLHSEFSAQEHSLMCKDLASAVRSGQNEPFCRQGLAKGFLPQGELSRCISGTIELRGQPALCDAKSDARINGGKQAVTAKTTCREQASLVAALRSNDPKACEASPLCRALSSGKAQDCEPYAQAANKSFCETAAKMAQWQDAENKRLAASPPLPRRDDAEVERNSKAAAAPHKMADPAAAVLKAKASKEEAAARELALKKAAAEIVQRKLIIEEKNRQALAARKKKEIAKQHRPSDRLQTEGSAVKKQLADIEKRTKEAAAAQPVPPVAAPQMPAPQSMGH